VTPLATLRLTGEATMAGGTPVTVSTSRGAGHRAVKVGDGHAVSTRLSELTFVRLRIEPVAPAIARRAIKDPLVSQGR